MNTSRYGVVSAAIAILALMCGCPGTGMDNVTGFVITETIPAEGATDVAREVRLEVQFSRAVNPETLAGYIRPQIDLDISWSADRTRLTMVPVAPLESDTTYALTIESIHSESGDRLMQAVTVCFSTGAALGECPRPVPCQAHDATDPNVQDYASYAYSPFFAANSVWNTPIPANPDIDAQSAALVDRMVQVGSQNGLWLGFDQYTPAIYFAAAGAATEQVEITSPFWTGNPLMQLPIPSYALPGCGDDNLMMVFDTASNRAYDLFQAAPQSDGSWTATWMAEYDLDADGVGAGIRAAHFPLAAGLVWPHELADGKIEHALVFAYSFVRQDVLTPPATATDGANADAAALPMGARIQLDPSLDLDTLGLTAHERTIARALQEYGMFLGDSAGSIALTAVHPYTFAGNPYDGLLPESVTVEGGTLLEHIPVDRFRVLKMDVQAAP